MTAIRVRLAPPGTVVSETPAPVEFWIAPPVQVAALVHVPTGLFPAALLFDQTAPIVLEGFGFGAALLAILALAVLAVILLATASVAVLARRAEIDAGQVVAIRTVAGTGTPGFSGDGGPATAAQINIGNGVFIDEGGIAVDPAGEHRPNPFTAPLKETSCIAERSSPPPWPPPRRLGAPPPPEGQFQPTMSPIA